MMMVTICPVETSFRVLNSANSGDGSKNDQAWVSRSRYQTRVRVPFSMRSSKASSDERVMMSAISRKVDTLMPVATRAYPHFHRVGAGGELWHQRHAFPLTAAVALCQFTDGGSGNCNVTDEHTLTGV